MPIQNEYLLAIKSGSKTVEGRLGTATAKKIKENDIINFQCGALNEKCLVTSIRNYKTFADMLDAEGLQKMLPGCDSIENGVKIYHRFPYYKRDEKEKGAVAFSIEVVSDEDISTSIKKDKLYEDIPEHFMPTKEKIIPTIIDKDEKTSSILSTSFVDKNVLQGIY